MRKDKKSKHCFEKSLSPVDKINRILKIGREGETSHV